MRAPTPTGAAEMAVPVKADLDAQLAGLAARLRGSASRHMDQRRQSVRALVRALPSLDQLLALPRRRFDEAAANLGRGLERTTVVKRRSLEQATAGLRLDLLMNRVAERRRFVGEQVLRKERCLERHMLRERGRVERADAALSALPARILGHVQREKQHLSSLARHAENAVSHALARSRAAILSQDRVLQSLSYKNVLKRGYAVVRGADDRPLTRAGAVATGQALSIEFTDGRVEAVAGAVPDGAIMPPAADTTRKRAAPKAAPTAASPGEPPKQGSLF
jgi:exodeoxyribonuclease VII large subunit